MNNDSNAIALYNPFSINTFVSKVKETFSSQQTNGNNGTVALHDSRGSTGFVSKDRDADQSHQVPHVGHTDSYVVPSLDVENTVPQHPSPLEVIGQQIQEEVTSRSKNNHLSQNESIILSILTNPQNWLIIIPTLTIVSWYFRRFGLEKIFAGKMNPPEQKVDPPPPDEKVADSQIFESKLNEWLEQMSLQDNGPNKSDKPDKPDRPEMEENDQRKMLVTLTSKINSYSENTEQMLLKDVSNPSFSKLKTYFENFKTYFANLKTNFRKKIRHPTVHQIEEILKTIITLHSIVLLKFVSQS